MPDSSALTWDIFCRVIDNHGDLGVCWRLSRELATRGHAVRLWVDDASALTWMAPDAAPHVQVLPWAQPIAPDVLAALPPSDVWVEAFGCEIAPEFIARHAHANSRGSAKPPVWINLEYLSAEAWVPRMHALPSPVLHGPAAGWTKWFFYPGFTPGTGGLLREADVPARQAAFDRAAWLRAQGIEWQGERLVSLFCYEPPALAALMRQLTEGDVPTRLLVTAGRAAAAVRQALNSPCMPSGHPRIPEAGLAPSPAGGRLGWGPTTLAPSPWSAPTPALPQRGREQGNEPIAYLPHLPQTAYDELLWACDLNFVRGEDSLVRALWAGAPFVWHIYPQPEDNAHHAKLAAFLDWLQAPPSLRAFHHVWNGVIHGPLPAPDLPAWRACVQAARARLCAQADLATQLTGFVMGKR
ncbi:MAG: elongation factor P maturation arginine rhamnosyltransferase EarP [Pseudomonadota bacterium]|nr:elongation factor P maturation arginine rhamnosyltransferase EarP [Pseudomonadota bacterium]